MLSSSISRGHQLARSIGAQSCSNHINKPARRHNSMFAWKISDSLNNPQEADVRSKLKLVETKLPTISSPSEVLVKVHSTSVNPLDVRMVYGYGRRVLDLLSMATNYDQSITNDRYPLSLGRDFSGEVIATGPCAKDLYKPGDLVFGAVEPQRSGAHAQFITLPSSCLSKKPENLTHQQAASIPFAALTAYSALCTFGHLSRDKCHNKQVLVIGGSGGVGSLAVQLLKLWGANVTATCAEEKLEWLENTLLVDRAICYNDLSLMDTLQGQFDFVLDCGDYDAVTREREDIVEGSLKYLKPQSQSVYVTLSPPILSNTDQNGIVIGGAKTLADAVCDTLRGLKNFNSARWAVFLPNKSALDYMASLFGEESLQPQVSSVFGFHHMPEAFEELQSGRTKGKVVVDVTQFESGQKLSSPESSTSSSADRTSSASPNEPK